MGRPKGDQKYRNEVIIIEENKKWKCKHCEGTYSGGFSRIKAHLDKTQGKGISKCRVYRNKEGASSSIDPQEPINTLNPSQAHQGAAGMIDTTGGGSINHQTNRESSYLLGGAWGTIDHQTNIESSSLLRVAEGPHEMIDGGLIDERNNTQLTLQANQGARGMIDTTGGGGSIILHRESSYLLGVAEGPHNMIEGSSIAQQNNLQSILLEAHQDAPGMIDTTVGGDSINHQTNRVSSSLLGGCADLGGVTGGSNGYSDLRTSLRSELNDLVSDLTRAEKDIKGQLDWLESRGKKQKQESKTEVDDWLDELKQLKREPIDMNNSLHQIGPDVAPVLEIPDSDDELLDAVELAAKLSDLLERKPLVLSNEFIGPQFENNVNEMWELLEDDDKVMTIGIHGMGGAGKTYLATYMHNEIKKKKATFEHVFWVTVSRDFTIFKLQHHIAQTIGFKLDLDCEDTRAIILASELDKFEKTVLILDDVWNYIDLQKVGIPLKPNGIKLIITTRLKHVCQQMDCLPWNNLIQIEPWKRWLEESWELFLLKLGQHGTPATLPPQVLEIARSVVKKCDGLPLGISVMARTMKGRDDIVWWTRALENFEMGQEMKEEVFTILKRSYDHLIEQDLRNCFLHCALLPSDIERQDLIRKLTGVLNGKRSLREIFDQAHTIVDKLIDHSLLFFVREGWTTQMTKSVVLNGKRSLKEIYEAHTIVDKLIDHSLLLFDEDGVIKMNGLVRIMACHIRNMMVKCNEGLIKIPHLREWRVDLEAVSLAYNKIKEIGKGTSPNCPRLSTLILSDNEISDIPECFFTHMNALTLLDLSYNPTLTSLPNSLSNLTSLTCLDLRECGRLEYIPPLGALQALSRLDISHCSISQVPKGLQNLINLKWLDLSWTKNSTFITVPGSVLSGLTNMQYLDLRGCTGTKVEDLQGMTMLECFGGTFLNWGDYKCYVQDILDSGYGPETYLIHYGELKNASQKKNGELTDSDYEDLIYLELKRRSRKRRSRSVWFGDCEELHYLLPKKLTELRVVGNNQWVRLYSALFSTGSSVKNIHIKDCEKLESLFCLSSSRSLCPNIQNLESLHLDNLKSLTAICKEDDVDLPQSSSRSGVFSHLTSLYINECHEIEMLLTPALVPQLQNLECLSVRKCKSMKEIFAASSSGDDDTFNITLPKLTELELRNLPELKSVCKGILVCGSEYILTNIRDCPQLEEPPKIHRHH